MKVYYRTYQLHPLRKANRLSDTQLKMGVHFKVQYAGGENFADYFPHLSLGDLPTEEFLDKFKFQDREYEQKIFYFLLNEHELRAQTPKTFFNHQLITDSLAPVSPILKYKLQDVDDFNFLKYLEKGFSLRLDANGLFTNDSLATFVSKIPSSLKEKIEYLEDPTKEIKWPETSLRWGRDFINGTPFEVLIHKPNCRFYVQQEKMTIFSSYMGSSLGLWHAYLEVLKLADLKLTHGLLTPQLYQEELELFSGNYQEGFSINEIAVKTLYKDLSSSSWKILCSI
jgi:hypothetical protein